MMNEKRSALLIFDDKSLSSELSEVLRHAGFMVRESDGRQTGTQLVEPDTDLVVLGSLLLGLDAHEVIRRLRSHTNAHIIHIMDQLDEFDAVLALEAGADQFMVSPISLREFRARVNAILRLRDRLMRHPEVSELEASELAQHGDLLLNAGTWEVSISGEIIPLTATEFSLLHVLMSPPGRVRSKQELARHANGYDEHKDSYISEADQRSIEVHIANLRRKLGDSARDPKWIETVRGVGYRMVVEHRMPNSQQG